MCLYETIYKQTSQWANVELPGQSSMEDSPSFGVEGLCVYGGIGDWSRKKLGIFRKCQKLVCGVNLFCGVGGDSLSSHSDPQNDGPAGNAACSLTSINLT